MKGRVTVLCQARRWRRWAAVVERVARHGGVRMGPGEYEALHGEVLAGCRALAESGGDEDRSFYHSLEGLAGPWLGPHVLAQADREILADLLTRCRDAERQMNHRVWLAVTDGRAARLILFVLVAVAVALPLATADRLLPTVLERARQAAHLLEHAVLQSSAFERLFAAGVLAVLVAVFVVSRSART